MVLRVTTVLGATIAVGATIVVGATIAVGATIVIGATLDDGRGLPAFLGITNPLVLVGEGEEVRLPFFLGIMYPFVLTGEDVLLLSPMLCISCFAGETMGVTGMGTLGYMKRVNLQTNRIFDRHFNFLEPMYLQQGMMGNDPLLPGNTNSLEYVLKNTNFNIYYTSENTLSLQTIPLLARRSIFSLMINLRNAEGENDKPSG